MKLIVINKTSDQLSYVLGSISCQANGNTEISQSSWQDLYADNDFIKDLRLQNIYVNDGSRDFFGDSAVNYLKSIVPQDTAQKLGIDVLQDHGVSVNFTATRNQETTYDYAIPSGIIATQGSTAIFPNAVVGDFLKLQIIDKDNVLGQGSNFIVSTPVEKWFIFPGFPLSNQRMSVTKFSLPGLYLRFIYTSTNANPLGANVTVLINFFTYKNKPLT